MNNFNKNDYFNAFPEYLSVKNGRLFFKDVDLTEVCQKYDVDNVALKCYCPDIIKDNILTYKGYIQNALKETHYPKDYLYAYASKVNYSKEVLTEAIKYTDLIETSSANDLMIYEHLLAQNIISDHITIISNGPKNRLYLDTINRITANYPNVHIITTVDSLGELYLLDSYKRPFTIGMRFSPHYLNPDIKIEADRFGFQEQFIPELISFLDTHPLLTPKMTSMHYAHCLDLKEPWLKAISSLIKNVYSVFSKRYPTIDTVDFGGGLPSRGYHKDYFDFKTFPVLLMNTVLNNLVDTSAPTIIGEYGRYTVSDSQFILTKINYIQNYNENNILYNMNASLMVYMADSWSFLDDYMILPCNHIDHEFHDVKVAGPTCDPGDIYHYRRNDPLTPMPIVDKDETLYCAIFTAGCYQNSVSGFGGAHHCLIPEGSELLIKANDQGHYEVSELYPRQTINTILKLLHY